jgi:acetylornithine deacetylase/succinyl-diaminopimelate desuccinylase-like protein
MSTVVKHIRAARKAHLAQFSELLSIPSVSTDSRHARDVRRAGDWVRKKLKQAGCTRVELHDTPRHPIVYGEWLGAPAAPTILVYGHYDVQPVDPLELWDHPPFDPLVKNGRIYARGASDNKGQFLAHVNAFESHMRGNGRCPVNIKFLIEGEEEIGSPNLDSFIVENRKRLACDAVIVSDTAMFGAGVPSICYGLRGLAYLEIHVRGTDRDLHSGTFGGSVINPANALVEMLAALKDSRGRVSVPGFYDKVRRLRPAERRAFAALPHSDRRWKREVGAPQLYGEAGYSTLERIWTRPTLDVNGIWGGFTGEGAKTVIPAEASAKISMRLVPDQRPKEIARKVTAQLKQLAPRSVKVTVRELHGGDAWIAPTDHPAMQAAARALRRAFGKKAVLVREGGSIPIVADFERRLKVPAVLMGLGLNDDNLHAPNEKMELNNFYRGIEASAFLMEELGAAAGNGRGSRATKRR